MNLPTPTPEEVEAFAALYQREFGVVLKRERAWDAATRTLRLFYLATYGTASESARAGAGREEPEGRTRARS